ncbi:MAG TPA: NDP-hexose 2,3-dehydratase family protein [Candidatus Marinimicrobia bacterium]|nr:NDP-hexose 2,3-dehydratase family protein [Candidatus Neomarinimicrobiota bacterium]
MFKNKENIEQRFNQFLECINDEKGIDEVLNWLQDIKDNLPTKVFEIKLSEVNDGWRMNDETGNFEHKTGGFFKVIGVKTETNIRESGKGWNQPIVDQGTESSVVGLARQLDIDGTPRYLIEAKFEPGNYDEVLLSPTLQVTYDNLNKLHDGRKPLFSEYFDSREQRGIVKFEHWYPEDGGRFYKKRVKNMLVETNDISDIPKNFIWLNMYQLKELLKLDNIMNPHLRSIISYL